MSQTTDASILTEQSPPYRIDYRPNFTKETAAHYGRKGGLVTGAMAMERARAAREAKRKAKLLEASVEPKVAALRKMQRRALQQAMAENDSRKQLEFMRSYTMAFDAEQVLLGGSPNSTKNHSLQKLQPIAPLSGNQGVSKPIAEPAKVQQPQPPVSSPITPQSPDDDCPF